MVRRRRRWSVRRGSWKRRLSRRADGAGSIAAEASGRNDGLEFHEVEVADHLQRVGGGAVLEALPENLEDSATAEALLAICDIDLTDLQAIVPPRGFGRD